MPTTNEGQNAVIKNVICRCFIQSREHNRNSQLHYKLTAKTFYSRIIGGHLYNNHDDDDDDYDDDDEEEEEEAGQGGRGSSRDKV
jgi:hypothetical protein